jgi:hypothetical protein
LFINEKEAENRLLGSADAGIVDTRRRRLLFFDILKGGIFDRRGTRITPTLHARGEAQIFVTPCNTYLRVP